MKTPTGTEFVFSHTNEDLEAIVRGLDINSSDTVLSIGGSGDQAFAILEHVGKVIVVDYDSAQGEYIQRRSGHLKAGDFESFYHKDNDAHGKNGEYLNAERMLAIREKLQFLEIAPVMDIFDAAEIFDYNKAYLSSATAYWEIFGTSSENVKCSLARVAKNMPKEGLIYVTDHGDLMGLLHTNDFLPECLVIDERLTELAQRLEKEAKTFKPNTLLDWQPAVYRKTC